MRIIPVLLCLLVSAPAPIPQTARTYDAQFTGDTMRVDYFHTGGPAGVETIALDRVVNRGRRVQTGTIAWFLSLYCVSALRPLRRRLLRHERETAHLDAWVSLARRTAETDYDLAVEVLACRRLVKGYSDTHARGTSKFDRVLAEVPGLLGKPDGAAWLRRLRDEAFVENRM